MGCIFMSNNKATGLLGRIPGAAKNELKRLRLLLRNVPPVTMSVFVLSVFSMNLLANKSIDLPFDWLALDCGIIVSWLCFLSMDLLTASFGPGASTRLSVIAMLISLGMCGVFYLGGAIPGSWGESFVPEGGELINTALDNTFGGTWYVLFGSAAAFLISSAVNNLINHRIGSAFVKKPDGAAAYAARTYISTAVGQFVDNMVFSLLVSHNFFGWSLLQCVTCSVTGMVVELLCELIFFGLGYRIFKSWRAQGVGREYLAATGQAQLGR